MKAPAQLLPERLLHEFRVLVFTSITSIDHFHYNVTLKPHTHITASAVNTRETHENCRNRSDTSHEKVTHEKLQTKSQRLETSGPTARMSRPNQNGLNQDGHLFSCQVMERSLVICITSTPFLWWPLLATLGALRV